MKISNSLGKVLHVLKPGDPLPVKIETATEQPVSTDAGGGNASS